MKLSKKIEIAKVGNWNGIDLNEIMLMEMVKNFQAVPIRAGHLPVEKGQKTDGYIKSVGYDNGTLLAEIELSDSLAEDYQNKKYISWSLDAGKYDNGWNLTALALLGAEKPAIKGLKELQFSENETKLNIKFEERKIMNPEEITKIAQALASELKFSEGEANSKAEFEALKAENEALKLELANLKGETAKKDEKLAEFAEKEKKQADQIKADHNTRVETKVKEIMTFSEPEAEKFKSLFFDKPETAVFMENYAVKDTRAAEPDNKVLSFSEPEKKPESVTAARLKNKNKRG